MPKKLDEYRTHGEKIISLFARLLFSRESHSLTDLARMLNCSKQSVLRYIEDIQRSYGIEVEEEVKNRRKYYRIKRQFPPAAVSLSETELTALYMCRAFTEHLLGKKNFDASTRALEKSLALYPMEKNTPSRHFGSFRPGSIDYTPFHDTLLLLIEAMNDRKICKISYQAVMAPRAKSLYIQPFKIFSHHESLYLHARKAGPPNEKYTEPAFDPLLAVHRIKKVELTDRKFNIPPDYDFEKFFNQNFGLMKDESFQAVVEFDNSAATYVSERIWSPDQKIKRLGNGKLQLTLTSNSEAELVSWVLSFGAKAKLLAPEGVVKELGIITKAMSKYYLISVNLPQAVTPACF